MFEWIVLGLVCVLVIGVSIYRHYKGDNESEENIGKIEQTVVSETDTVENIRPEVIEMCKDEYWGHLINKNGAFIIDFIPDNNLYIGYFKGHWLESKYFRCFMTDDEISYVINFVKSKIITSRCFQKLSEDLKNAKVD